MARQKVAKHHAATERARREEEAQRREAEVMAQRRAAEEQAAQNAAKREELVEDLLISTGEHANPFADPAPESLPMLADGEDEEPWSCPACSFDNHGAVTECEMCETPSPRHLQSSSIHQRVANVTASTATVVMSKVAPGDASLVSSIEGAITSPLDRSEPPSAASSGAIQEWNCPACSFSNRAAIAFCELCDTPAPQ